MIRYIIQMSLEIAICTLISLEHPTWVADEYGLYVSQYIGVFQGVMVAIFAIAVPIFFVKNMHILENPSF